MIVLDEQLMGRAIETEIARWYPGNVRFIIELRSGTVIKDDAIPALLREQNSPTFVTINVRIVLPAPLICSESPNNPELGLRTEAVAAPVPDDHPCAGYQARPRRPKA